MVHNNIVLRVEPKFEQEPKSLRFTYRQYTVSITDLFTTRRVVWVVKHVSQATKYFLQCHESCGAYLKYLILY